MDAGKLTLTVVTPEGAVVEKVSCDEVTLPGENGELGILPGHTALVVLLGTGVVSYRTAGKKTLLAVRSGFAEVADDVVRVLADQAVDAAGADVAAATRVREEGNRKRLEVVGQEELDMVNSEIRFAEAQIEVASAN